MNVTAVASPGLVVDVEDRKRALAAALWLFLALLLVRLPAQPPRAPEPMGLMSPPLSILDPADALPPPPPPEPLREPDDLPPVVLPVVDDHEVLPVAEPDPDAPELDVDWSPSAVPAAPARRPPARGREKPFVVGLAGLEPPVALHAPRPEHPALERRFGVTGTVRLRLTIGADGRVIAVEVLSVEPERESFERAAVESVRLWRYEPARFEGREVPALHRVTIHFGS